jgi:hypothetical protein
VILYVLWSLRGIKNTFYVDKLIIDNFYGESRLIEGGVISCDAVHRTSSPEFVFSGSGRVNENYQRIGVFIEK